MKLTEKKKDKAKVSIAVEGDVTIYSVKEMKDGLSVYFDSPKNMEFDLSEIKKIDTAGFQLLLMLKKEAAGSGREIVLINPSDEVTRIFELYGEVI